MTLFSRNFAYAKFLENKTLVKISEFYSNVNKEWLLDLTSLFDTNVIWFGSSSSTGQAGKAQSRLLIEVFIAFFVLFDLILYAPVNYLSVMSGRVFLG